MQITTLKKIDFLLIKLKQFTESKNDKELCLKLNINYSTLDTWKNNDKIPEKRLIEFANKLNIPFEELISEERAIISKKIEDENEFSKYFTALQSVAIVTNKEDELLTDIKELIKKYMQIL